MNFAPLIFCTNALEGFYAHRERKALHRIGRKIRLQQLSDQEFAGVEARCTSLNLNVHNTDLRLVRALTQHVVRMERLRRELVPLWTRAEMLAMVEPHNLINRDRIETCLHWLRAGEHAFHQYAQSVEAQFDRYLNQLGTVAPPGQRCRIDGQKFAEFAVATPAFAHAHIARAANHSTATCGGQSAGNAWTSSD